MGDANLKEDLRQAILTDDDCDSVIVHHKGKAFEIKPPTLAQQKSVELRSKDRKTGETDSINMVALMVIECTYEPGTNNRVLELKDLPYILEKSNAPGTIIGKLMRAMRKLLDAKPEEIEADFERSP